jgi:hypothetical protein
VVVVITLSRAISPPLHAAIETLAAPAIMAAPFVLGMGQVAGAITIGIGAVLLGLSLQLVGPRRSVPISVHAAFDYLLAATAAVVGLVAAIVGDWTATAFLVGLGAAQVTLTASTRFSVPVGA